MSLGSTPIFLPSPRIFTHPFRGETDRRAILSGEPFLELNYSVDPSECPPKGRTEREPWFTPGISTGISEENDNGTTTERIRPPSTHKEPSIP